MAVFCVGFAKRISTYHPARAAVMFLVEVLPVLILPFLYRAIMICYVQVANVECMREGRVIMRVIRMQKTRTTLRVLKLLRFALGWALCGCPTCFHLTGSLHSDQLSAQGQAQVAPSRARPDDNVER